MIKVLHVISDTGIGGAGVLLLNLLTHGDIARFSYSVALPRKSLLVPKIQEIGIHTIPLDCLEDQSADLSAIPPLLSLLTKEKPDILHTHASVSARFAGLLAGVSIRVNTKHCLTGGGGVRPFRSMLENILATHHIATAEAAGAVLLSEGIHRNKIHIIENGSDPIPPLSNEEKSSLRRELALPESAFVIGMAARMESGKGQEILLEAAKLIAHQEPSLVFLFAGTGRLENDLRQRAKEWGLSENVKFLGFRADVGRIMNLFDLNINASYISETSSLALSEGMSLGIVPIVSRVGGNPLMADFGRCGVIVPPRDPEALAEAILALYHSPRARAELSRRAFAHYEAHFCAEDMARRTEALYLSALHPSTIDKMLTP